MILAFSRKFPWGEPTFFKEKILLPYKDQLPAVLAFRPINLQFDITMPPKLHSIREGHRWKAGMLLHMAYGIRSKNYEQFNIGVPALQKVVSVQAVIINPKMRTVKINQGRNSWRTLYLQSEAQREFIVNDGFANASEFWRWFDTPFSGEIIHWTNLEY